jgi:transcriptional regulator with XRE-family HTH domain
MNNEVNIGYKLEKLRKMKGFSQEYLAEKLNISQPAYSKIERGEIKVSLEKLPQIAEIFETDLDILLSFDPANIFNNSPQSGNMGNGHTYQFNSLDEIKQLYEALLQEKDARISFLESQLKKGTP